MTGDELIEALELPSASRVDRRVPMVQGRLEPPADAWVHRRQ